MVLTASLAVVVLVLTPMAIVLLHPGLPFRLLPEWGTSPSVNQVVGAFIVVLLLNMVFEEFAKYVATSGPVPTVTTLGGETATLVKRGATFFAAQMSAIISTALLLGVLAWLGFRAGSTVIALLLTVCAVWLGSVIVPMVLRRYTPGGVWLTPTGLTDRFRGREVAVAWDDVAAAEFGVPDLVAWIGHTALPVGVHTRRERTYTVKHLAGIWKNPRKPTNSSVFLETRELGVNPGTLVQVIVHYAQNPARRHELGTEPSLTTVAMLRDDSGVTRGYLPVAPAPAAPQAYPPAQP